MRPVSAVLNEAILPDVIVCPDSVGTHFSLKLWPTLYANLAFSIFYFVILKAQEKSEAALRTEGYSRVNTQDQELKGGRESEESHTNAAVNEADAEKSKESSDSKAAEKLSTSQLIMRRGLTLLFSVLILITGVVFQIAFPVAAPSAQSVANATLDWVNFSTPTPLDALNLTTSLWASWNGDPCWQHVVTAPAPCSARRRRKTPYWPTAEWIHRSQQAIWNSTD